MQKSKLGFIFLSLFSVAVVLVLLGVGVSGDEDGQDAQVFRRLRRAASDITEEVKEVLQISQKPAEGVLEQYVQGKLLLPFQEPTQVLASAKQPILAITPVLEGDITNEGIFALPILGDVRFASLDEEGRLDFSSRASTGNIEAVAGSYIVEFTSTIRISNKKFINRTSFEGRVKKFGSYTARELFRTHRDTNDPLAHFAVITVNPDVPRDAVIRELTKASDVKSVSPNYLAKTFLTDPNTTRGSKTSISGINNPAPIQKPNDPLFSQQWHHEKLDSLKAWNISRGKNVVVAVIDTDVDWAHEDLQQNIWANVDEISGNGIDDDGNGYIDDIVGWDFVDTVPWSQYPQEDYQNEDNDPSGYFGHGTHVAGIIGSTLNNQKGGAGVCPNCKIMALRAGYTPGYLDYVDIAEALIYAADNGADVINMSFGGFYDEPSMKAAIDYAYQKGVVLVAAAGNSAINSELLPFYPASYENVISVAATDSNDWPAFFTNYGLYVDVAAPGEDILSTVPMGAYYLSAFCPPKSSGVRYGKCSGTSMASPVVAGVAGLLKDVGKKTTPQMIQSAIESGAERFGKELPSLTQNRFIGSGRVNVAQAIAIMKQFPQGVALMDESVLVGSGSMGEIIGNTTITGNVGGSGFNTADITISNGVYSYIPLAGFTETITQPVNNGFLFTIQTGSLKNGDYTLHLTVKDASGTMIRRTQKPITVKNVELIEPFPTFVINPNGSLDFIGTIGGNISQYDFSYSFDGSSYISAGFTYPLGNTSEIINSLLVTWSSPGSLIGQGSIFFKLTISSPSGDITYVFPFQYDGSIASGFPKSFSAKLPYLSPNFGMPILLPWDTTGAGDVKMATYVYSFDIMSVSKTIEAFLFDKNGNIENGWPQELPSPVSIGGITYSIAGSAGHAASLGDVDDDGKDELLIHAPYFGYSSKDTYYQSFIYAFNEDGSMVSGFPIVTNNDPISNFSFLPQAFSPVLVADLDNDGINELVFISTDVSEINIVNTTNLVIAKKSQGVYIPTTFPQQFPASEFSSGLLESYSRLALVNADGDSDMEIALTSPPIYKYAGSIPSVFSELTIINPDGIIVSGWPVTLGKVNNYLEGEFIPEISIGSINSENVLAVSTHKGSAYIAGNQSYRKFYLFDMQGNIKQGWPKTEYASYGSIPIFSNAPIFTDLNDDSVSEIVFDGRIVADVFTGDGTKIAQFSTPNPAADVIGGRSFVTAQDLNQRLLLISSGPNGISFGSNIQPTIYAFRINSPGNLVFSKAVGGDSLSFPLINDFDGDGLNELASLGKKIINEPTAIQKFYLYVWDLPSDLSEYDWPTYMHDNQRTNALEECSTPVNGEIITDSVKFCSGNYSLPNGITIRAESVVPITVTCKGTNFNGVGIHNSTVGIHITATTDGIGDVTLQGCNISDHETGIRVSNKLNFSIEDNMITDTTRGIVVQTSTATQGSYNASISDNTIRGIATWNTTGILIDSFSPGLLVDNNTIESTFDGISILHTNGITLKNNLIMEVPYGPLPKRYGIGLLGNTTNGVITNNTVIGYQFNLKIRDSGVQGWKIYQNNFLANANTAQNASEWANLNTYYNPATQQGNYWSDHICIDNQSPFGICENFYGIPASYSGVLSKDLYPFKDPIPF